MRRILPSEGIKQEVEAILDGQGAPGHPLDQLVQLGARYLPQKALEREVEEFPGGLLLPWEPGPRLAQRA